MNEKRMRILKKKIQEILENKRKKQEKKKLTDASTSSFGLSVMFPVPRSPETENLTPLFVVEIVTVSPRFVKSYFV